MHDVRIEQIATTLGALVAAADDQPEQRLVSAWTRLTSRDWPVKIAYHMKKLNKFVREEVRNFNDLREASIKELGVKLPDDGGWTMHTAPPANRTIFQQRMEELAAQPVTIPWKPIELADLGEVAISGADLAALDPLIVGEPTP